jgi:choline dehydrogenase-like flavoprotein
MPIIDVKKDNISKIIADVCIIGSGPAGAFAAVELAKMNINVIILEPGSNLGTQISSIDQINTLNEAFKIWDKKSFGGLSNWWAGRIAVLDNFDFINCFDNGAIAWPISFKDILPHYRKASKIMSIPFDEIWSSNLLKSKFFDEYRLSSSFSEKSFFWSPCPPFNTAKYLQENANKYENLTIYLGIQASHFKQISENKIDSLEAASANHLKKINVTCKTYILAAGGIENPKILLNSKEKNKKFKMAYSNIIGKGLMTHPKAIIGKLTLNFHTNIKDRLFSDIFYLNGEHRIAIGLNNSLLKKNNLNHCFFISPLIKDKVTDILIRLAESKYFTKSGRAGEIIYSFTLRAYNKLHNILNIKKTSDTFILRAFFDQIPTNKNRVYLSNKIDNIGNRKVNIEWKLMEKDKKSIIKLIKTIKNFFESNKIGNLECEFHDFKKIQVTEIHSHFIGTTRMGKNKNKSVVDKNCRVHNIKNLYISGPSVFPIGGYANPFLTIAAFSCRLGMHISKKYLKKNLD